MKPCDEMTELVTFPAHALLIVEERLREQEADGVEMPVGMEREELALCVPDSGPPLP